MSQFRTEFLDSRCMKPFLKSLVQPFVVCCMCDHLCLDCFVLCVVVCAKVVEPKWQQMVQKIGSAESVEQVESLIQKPKLTSSKKNGGKMMRDFDATVIDEVVET